MMLLFIVVVLREKTFLFCFQVTASTLLAEIREGLKGSINIGLELKHSSDNTLVRSFFLF